MTQNHFKILGFYQLIFMILLLLGAHAFAASETGGADTGGGNTINGIIIENYQQATEELDGWNGAQKIIQDIKQDIPKFGRALEERARELRWYILPTRLDQLPASITHIGARSEQMAVHIRGEIYIDAELWNAPDMTSAKKTAFILHEIILAQYFYIKNDSTLKYKKIQEALSMSDMRVISDLVTSYKSGQMNELQSELHARNYGYYLSTNVAQRYIALTLENLAYSQSICEKENSPRLSQVAQPLEILNLVYFNDPVPYGSDRSSEILSNQKLFQKQDELITPLFLLWSDIISGIYPDHYKMAPTRYSLSGPRLFEQVFSNQNSSEWDQLEGEKACRKLRIFNLRTLQINLTI